MKLLILGISVVTTVGLLAGCSSQVLTPPTPTPSPVNSVDPALFKAAKNLYKVSVDEFKGNVEMFATPKKSMNFRETSVSDAWGLLMVDITRANETAPYEFQLVSYYDGNDWMFHDEVDLKSDSGTFIGAVDSTTRNDQAQDGGRVTELGMQTLKKAQVAGFCKVFASNNIRVRLSGTNGQVTDMTSSLSPSAYKSIAAGCTIWQGLQQGYSPN